MRLSKKISVGLITGILASGQIIAQASTVSAAKSDILGQTTISVESARLRHDPDPYALITALLPEDEIVYIKGKYVDWYQVSLSDGREGYVYKGQLDETEYIKEVTSKKVEVINWSEASKILPRGGIAKIEDVYTGQTFMIKRTFGTNHADVETLTANDTKIMRQIWGGFTWERRPVIVHINGRRLAASMAGMPHAGKDSAPNLSYTSGLSGGYGYGQNLDAVKGNQMNGVCDLHFRGSRKHKDGKITATPDPKHQAAITIAANYKYSL
jgi:SH3-like domain-containing protein